MAKDDVVIKTIIAEAGGDPSAMAAVASVIRNRALKEGKTPEQIVKARGQFEGYSNPGPASKKAQQDAKVLARAREVWSGVQTGQVADPTNGATMYHADYASPYWAKSANKNGTVNIGGNVFYKGNGALPVSNSALEAINAAAPVPVPRPIVPDVSSYSNPQGVRSIEINPNGTPKGSLTDALAQRFGNATTRTANDASIYNIVPGYAPQPFVSEDHPRSNAVPIPTGLTSRKVNTVPIDPLTGNPLTAQQQLQQALDAKAAVARAAIVTPKASLAPSFVPPPPKVTIGSTPSYAPYSVPNLGAVRTTSQQAGNVALPAGVVPASVTRDLASIAAQQVNQSGSPDDRQRSIVPAAPVPMPGRPASLSAPALTAANTLAQGGQPYIPGPSGYSDNNKDLSRLVAEPSAPPTVQVLNPAYTAALKAGQAYTAGGSVVTQAQQNAFGGLNVPTTTAAKPLPPKYITVAVPHVPVPKAPAAIPLTSFNTVNPASQILPNVQSGFRSTPAGHIGSFLMGEPVQGGLLSLLNGHNPLAGGGGLLGGGAVPSGIVPGGGFLAARDVPTTNLTIGQQANELNKALAGGSRNPDGSRGFM